MRKVRNRIVRQPAAVARLGWKVVVPGSLREHPPGADWAFVNNPSFPEPQQVEVTINPFVRERS